MSFTLFRCVQNPNEEWTLTKDRSILCYEDKWFSMLAVAIASVLLYCVAFLVLLVCVICLVPRGSRFQVPGFQMRWKFLFIKFRPEAYWWGLVFLSRGIIMNAGFVMLTLG